MPPRLSAAGLAAGCLLATTAYAEPLALRPGLWEMTSTTQFGQMTITPAMQAQMPPAALAQMQAVFARMAKPHVLQKCITPDSLARALEFRTHGMQDCTHDIITNTAREFRMHAVCTLTNRGATSTADLQIHMLSDGPSHMTGTVDMTRAVKAGEPGPGKSHTDVDAVFKTADCGTVKPDMDGK